MAGPSEAEEASHPVAGVEGPSRAQPVLGAVHPEQRPVHPLLHHRGCGQRRPLRRQVRRVQRLQDVGRSQRQLLGHVRQGVRYTM